MLDEEWGGGGGEGAAQPDDKSKIKKEKKRKKRRRSSSSGNQNTGSFSLDLDKLKVFQAPAHRVPRGPTPRSGGRNARGRRRKGSAPSPNLGRKNWSGSC